MLQLFKDNDKYYLKDDNISNNDIEKTEINVSELKEPIYLIHDINDEQNTNFFKFEDGKACEIGVMRFEEFKNNNK